MCENCGMMCTEPKAHCSECILCSDCCMNAGRVQPAVAITLYQQHFPKSLMTWFFDTDGDLDRNNNKVMPCRNNTVSRAIAFPCAVTTNKQSSVTMFAGFSFELSYICFPSHNK
jgi:hypothetical protein